MKILVFSDPHFTDNQQDLYRFDLFDWLSEQQKKYSTDVVVCGGDLTVHKNKHSALLVNKIIDGFRKLKPPVYILLGNHDYIDPNNPYFEFINNIEGLFFCSKFTLVKEYKLAFVPHQLEQKDFDSCFSKIPDGYITFCHQTINGALSESGSQLNGFIVPPNRSMSIYSGDIHAPQKCGPLTYIGAPYAVRIGDVYEPRILLLDVENNIITEKDLHFKAPKKLHLYIRDVSEIPELDKGDQVSITLELTPEELVEWGNHKKAIIDHCRSNGIEVFNVEMKKKERRKRLRLEEIDKPKVNTKHDYFTNFCNEEKLPSKIREAGEYYIRT